MRLPDPRLKSGRPILFRFDGETVEAIEGETVGAALAAAGRLALRQTRSGTPRGLHCGMGACFDCVVTIDGRIGQRACLEKVREGSDVRSGLPEAEALNPLAAMPTGIAEIQTDVLVVGGGPAGLTAALGLARAGARVIVADERPAAGGQYFKPLAASWQAEEPLDRQFAAGAALVSEAVAEGVEIWQGAVVWLASIEDGFGIQHAGETRIVRPRATILATGAHETAAPMPGWTLPGVMTTGALQTLVRSYRVSPSRRVVIAGNGPLNLQLACELLRAGIRPLAVVEAAAPPWPGRLGTALRMAAADRGLALEGLRYLLLLRKAGVPVLWRSRVVGIEGETCAAAAVIAGPAGTRRVEADIVTLGYGFTPQAELARQLGCRVSGPAGACRVETDEMGRTSLAGIFAIGDGSAIGGARVAAAQGALAAIAAAEHLRIGTGEIAEQPAATRALARHRRFQSALWQAFAPVSRPGPLADETIACRCEEVSAGAIRRACRAEGASFAVVKRLTRAGMGRCQARFCAGTLAGLIEAEGGAAEAGFAPRAPAKPVPLAALALEKGEWGGHRLATPPATSPRAPRSREPFGTLRTDVAVIGAGVVGCCVARELAERGIAVTVLDRHEPNLQASGANAGSLHVQLLSFDFGSKAQAGGGPAAQTLRLGPIAVALWQSIERASGETLEIATPGGLMVAETAEELAFLERKAALERSHGIDTQVIGANELRALEPQLSGDLVGAAFCAQEGKINPLTATYAVARLARLAGARFEGFASVAAIGREGEGWRIETEAGVVLARRVVNAAGGWSSRISAMAGRPIPVHGAPLQMIVTEPGPKLVRHLVAHAGRHLSLKQADTGGLIIGGGWTAGLDEASGASRALRASIEGNAYVACRVLPAARGLHALRIWAGMNVNIDGAPIIGEMPGAPGFYNCVTSNGYTLAPAVARITAELVADGRSDLALPAYQLSRFG